jgi:hypothetical protein
LANTSCDAAFLMTAAPRMNIMEIVLIVHRQKHDSSIRTNCDRVQNVSDPIVASAKHNLPRVSTEQGMHIAFSEHRLKHKSSTRTIRVHM